MKGFTLTRTVRDGKTPDGRLRDAKRYDACWRVDTRRRSKTFAFDSHARAMTHPSRPTSRRCRELMGTK